ncbi:hypothetical protein HMPREF2909_04375 [Alloscardovia sp. HMSC034E08]|nr:hypothetical protein HMPREF2909_04375 [Alloscardovia sp. HMSC034E08]
MKQHGYVIKDAQRWLKRSYGYTQSRIRGQDSFSMNDLETIALRLGYASIFDFIDAQKQYTYGTVQQDNYEKVASQNDDRDIEAETPID